ncbi:MAG TPA: hypothetical protein VF656_03575 [Pyrinomonadaceae bacterium]|jgi:hypothetical protein
MATDKRQIQRAMRVQKFVVLLLLPVFTVLSLYPITSAAKKKPACVKTLGKCPAQGCGGDPKLNTFKNQMDSPAASDVEEWTIADIIELNETTPKTWKSGADRGPLEAIGEGKAVSVKGYLIHAKLTGTPESCNCFLQGAANNDFHLNIVPTRAGTMKQSLVIEMSPRSRNQQWKLPTMQALAGTKTYVRVTGWLMFDSAHAHFQSMPRATAWEVHPVTKFEVCQGTKKQCDAGNNWKALEDL